MEKSPLLTVECGEKNCRVYQAADVKKHEPLAFEQAGILTPR